MPVDSSLDSSIPAAGRPRALRFAAASAACCLLGAGLLTGCGEDQAQLALEDASRQLTALNAGANARQWTSDEVYNDVLSKLSSLPGSPTEAQQAAAALMTAQAHRGLAELHAAEASDLMSNAQRLIGPGEAELRAFEAAQSRAEVAASFDPSSLQQAIDDRRQAARAELSAITTQISALQQQASQLGEQIAQQRADADEQRLLAAELQSQVDQQDAVAGVATAQRAHEARRAADAIALRALELEQQVGIIEQQIAELEILSEKSTAQLAALDEAENALTERTQRIRSEAAEAQTTAQQAAQRFTAVVSGDGGLDQHHATLIPAPFDSAVEAYERAIRSAQQARSTDRASASLALGLAHHALANLHITRAEGLAAYASMLDAAGDLPGGQQFASRASQATDRLREHTLAAGAAYEEAIGGYEGSGARQEAADIRDELTARLAQLRARVLDEPLPAEDADDGGEGEG